MTPATDPASDELGARQRAFRVAMGNYPTGVAVVTTRARDGAPVGLTINSLASVSMDPLLLLWSVDSTAGCAPEFLDADGFAVHLLGAHQAQAALTFAAKGADRFSGHPWRWSERGYPILDDAAAVVECSLYRAVEAGDHTILIGEVLQVAQADHTALLYHRRGFHAVAPLPTPAEPIAATPHW